MKKVSGLGEEKCERVIWKEGGREGGGQWQGIDMRQGERERVGERYSATKGGKGRDGEKEGREGKRVDYGMLLTFQGLTEG